MSDAHVYHLRILSHHIVTYWQAHLSAGIALTGAVASLVSHPYYLGHNPLDPPSHPSQTYYPELLFPVRERRHRARGGGSGKFRATKTRGKMSQDGKGGRCVMIVLVRGWGAIGIERIPEGIFSTIHPP